MRAEHFRSWLRGRLEGHSDQVLLRILVSRTCPAPVEMTGADILRRSLELAQLAAATPEGGVVLLLLPHSVELFLLHIGLVLSGRLPAVLAWPTTRVDPRKYHQNLLYQLRNLPAGQLITLPALVRNLEGGLPYRVTECAISGAEPMERALTVPIEDEAWAKVPYQVADDTPRDGLFLQFSGGTTGAQKCVVVTAPMLERQLARLRDCLKFNDCDGVASWLPLYHDMGLIACLWLPLWIGAPSFHFSATDWLLEPDLLFQALDGNRGTFCWLPNFAFSYLASARERMRARYSLEHVRAFINCSEPVRLRSMRSFAEAFGEWGVNPGQLQASYAMAENVFAVTQTPLGEEPKTYPRSALRQNAAALSFDLLDDVYVSSGPALPGMGVRIRGQDGHFVEEGEPGGIEIRTESMFSGYWGNKGFQTSDLTPDAWYQTGDYGFLADGDLFVIGRSKDIIIVGGQNVFPEDIEAIANSAPGVYPGRVVALGFEDEEAATEAICVVAEMRGNYDPVTANKLALEIRSLIVSGVGIAPRYVLVKPERWIVKSTAGKISRRETRVRVLDELAERRRIETNGTN
ncbi:MAG: AMP-binding protein [Bryobacteraceae bacterium]|jgi:fatty-acyl-CoA synthase